MTMKMTYSALGVAVLVAVEETLGGEFREHPHQHFRTDQIVAPQVTMVTTTAMSMGISYTPGGTR